MSVKSDRGKSRLQADAHRRWSKAGAAAAAVVNKYPLRKVVEHHERHDLLDCGHQARVNAYDKQRPRRRCYDCHAATQPKGPRLSAETQAALATLKQARAK